MRYDTISRHYSRLMDVLYWICIIIPATALVVMTLLVTTSVFSRYVLSYGASFFEPFNMHVSASHQELQIVEDWAFAYGSYTLSLTSKTDDQVIEDKGKYINIFQYQPNGSWKYARLSFSSDIPLSGDQ